MFTWFLWDWGLQRRVLLYSAEVFGCFRLMTVNEEVGSSVKPCAANAEVRVHSEDKRLKSEWRHIHTCGSSFPQPNVRSVTKLEAYKHITRSIFRQFGPSYMAAGSNS